MSEGGHRRHGAAARASRPAPFPASGHTARSCRGPSRRRPAPCRESPCREACGFESRPLRHEETSRDVSSGFSDIQPPWAETRPIARGWIDGALSEPWPGFELGFECNGSQLCSRRSASLLQGLLPHLRRRRPVAARSRDALLRAGGADDQPRVPCASARIDEQRAAGELSDSSIRHNMNLLSRFFS